MTYADIVPRRNFFGHVASKTRSESPKEESLTAKRISVSRPSRVLSVVVAGDALLLGNLSCRLGLSSKHSLRRHVRLGRRCGDESLYRIGTPDLR